MADSKSTAKFPAPYINQVTENDPIIIRVDQDFGEIGSRPKTAPKDLLTSGMSIEHVGGSTNGSRSNNSDNS